MKKRLRKKLHKGEFKEMGFKIEFEYDPNLTKEDLDKLWLRFIEDAIEGNNLCVGGGGNYSQSYFVCRYKSSANQQDKDKLNKWFLSQKETIISFTISDLTDAWHGDF